MSANGSAWPSSISALFRAIRWALIRGLMLPRGYAAYVKLFYALAGLVLELDRWMAAGRRLPARWAQRAPSPSPHFVLGGESASNEVAPRRRHPPVRRRRAQAAAAQLAFPFGLALQG